MTAKRIFGNGNLLNGKGRNSQEVVIIHQSFRVNTGKVRKRDKLQPHRINLAILLATLKFVIIIVVAFVMVSTTLVQSFNLTDRELNPETVDSQIFQSTSLWYQMSPDKIVYFTFERVPTTVPYTVTIISERKYARIKCPAGTQQMDMLTKLKLLVN